MIEYQRESSELLIDAEAAGIYLTRPGFNPHIVTEGRETITKNNLQHNVNYISLLMPF